MEDDGNAIVSYVKTKDYDLGDIATQKSLNSIYLVALESGDWNLSIDYYLDKSASYTNTFNVDLDQSLFVADDIVMDKSGSQWKIDKTQPTADGQILCYDQAQNIFYEDMPVHYNYYILYVFSQFLFYNKLELKCV